VAGHGALRNAVVTMALSEPQITVSPDYLSGSPVFSSTLMPFQNLSDYRQESGFKAILESFPRVTREHALAVIKLVSVAGVKTSTEKRAA
jgi:uncharacterized protein (DUF433 family)